MKPRFDLSALVPVTIVIPTVDGGFAVAARSEELS
jgi:hypothetical protein